MLGKKKKELTAEEYRQKARDEISDVKKEWSTFFKTGIFMIAALIAIIIAGIAWFVSNNRVTGTGASIQAAGGEFDLAAAGKNGTYDKLLKVQAGTETTIGDKPYRSTDGSKTSITWAVSDESNVKNDRDRGIEPGSSGKLTFYIIPHKDGPLTVTLDLALTGYTANAEWSDGAGSGDLREIDDATQQLLEGHVLLFAGYNENSNSYSNWISEDADTWKMSLGTDAAATLTRNGDGKLVWSAENAAKETAYPVTIYWIWPEVLESYLRSADNYTGRRPLLFPQGGSDSADSSNSADHAGALTSKLFDKMCGVTGSASSNRYFLWGEDTQTFQTDVTVDRLSQMRTNFNPVIYGTIAAYYNAADQYLGENVRYLKLKLDAQ